MPGLTDGPGFKVEQIILERLKFEVREALGPAVLESISLERFHDMLREDMVLRLTAELLAERIESEQIVRTETVMHDFTALDGPFQRWKERHAASWWLFWFVKLRPLRFIAETKLSKVELRVSVDDYATFPKMALAPPPPEWGPVVFKRIVRADTYTKEL